MYILISEGQKLGLQSQVSTSELPYPLMCIIAHGMRCELTIILLAMSSVLTLQAWVIDRSSGELGSALRDDTAV